MNMERTTNILLRHEERIDGEISAIVEHTAIDSDSADLLTDVLCRMVRFLQGIGFSYVEALVANSHTSDGKPLSHSSYGD